MNTPIKAFVILLGILVEVTTAVDNTVSSEVITESKTAGTSFETNGRSLPFVLTKGLFLLAPIGWLIILLSLILLLPIPAIVAPPTGRLLNDGSILAKKVLESGECIEKMSCELNKVSKNYSFLHWVSSVVQSLIPQGTLRKRYERGLFGKCSAYKCYPFKESSRQLTEFR